MVNKKADQIVTNLVGSPEDKICCDVALFIASCGLYMPKINCVDETLFNCLFHVVLYVHSKQLWSCEDGQLS